MEPTDPPVRPAVNDPTIEAELARQTCAECGKVLAPGEGALLRTGQRFCQNCYGELRRHLERIADSEAQEVSYPAAMAGALVGGALGAVLWWQITVLTHLSIGIVAVGIAFLVAWGIRYATGGKRSPGLQKLAVGVSMVSFLAGMYLVNRSLILRSMSAGGEYMDLPLVGGPAYMWRILTVRIARDPGAFLDLLFAAITVYQAWILTRPLRIPRTN